MTNTNNLNRDNTDAAVFLAQPQLFFSKYCKTKKLSPNPSKKNLLVQSQQQHIITNDDF